MSLLTLSTLLLSGFLVACGSPTKGPYTPADEADRDPVKAAKLNEEAAELIKADPDRAEQLLREALTCDLYHGPAHNNLGVIFLERGELFEAANEFEWARKLLPGHPDPRLNLGLTLERAGRDLQAIERYRAALEVVPEHIPTIQALARLMVRSKTPWRISPSCWT